MAAKLLSSSLVVCVLAMCAVNMAYAASLSSSSSHNAPAPSVDCSFLILTMADCLSYVTNGSTVTTPEGTCCSALKNVLKTAPQCLFEAFKSSAWFRVVLNVTKALNLPAACKVSASSVDNCGLTEAPAAPPAAGSLPLESSPTPTSGGAAPGSTGPIGELSPATAPSPGNAASAFFLISAGSLLLCLSIAQSIIQLKLTDNDLREIKEEKITNSLPLKEKYSVETSSNKFYQRMRLYTFKYSGGKSMQEHIDDFNKMISDVGVAGIEVEDVDQALILLASVPLSNNNLCDAIFYDRPDFSVKIVKELLIKMENAKLLSGLGAENHADELFVTRAHNQERGSKNKRKRISESKKYKFVMCSHCHQTEHSQRNFIEREEKPGDFTNITIEGSDDSDASSNSIVITCDMGNERILDSKPSYKKQEIKVKSGIRRTIPIEGQ